jgi:hypothetical protein
MPAFNHISKADTSLPVNVSLRWRGLVQPQCRDQGRQQRSVDRQCE